MLPLLKASGAALLAVTIAAGLVRLTGCETYYGYYLPPSNFIPRYCRMHEAKIEMADEIAATRPLKKYEEKDFAQSRRFVKEQCS